jgi:hypothetical protein
LNPIEDLAQQVLWCLCLGLKLRYDGEANIEQLMSIIESKEKDFLPIPISRVLDLKT